jgi:hypothetical protein
VEAVAELLGRGLGYKSSYFLDLIEVMRQHDTPRDCPRFGYLLEDTGAVVGAILLIFSTSGKRKAEPLRCHITGWYVEPTYRAFATLFFRNILKRKDVSFLNISARPQTHPIISAQGFTKYSSGQFLAVPLLQFGTRVAGATVVRFEEKSGGCFDSEDFDIMAAHNKFGCICIWCVTADRAYPFIFRQRFLKGFLPGVQLIYCPNIETFVRFSYPLGMYLASLGNFFVVTDANGRIPGLFGIYFDGMEPRYYQGPKPRIGDLAFTERAMRPDVRRNFNAKPWFPFSR